MDEIIYNRENTINAWHQFIETGDVSEGSVRPYILDSWKRCRDLGVDPFGVTYPRLSRSTLKKKQEENSELLSFAIPIMHTIHAAMACGGLSLSSPDFFTYFLLSEYESDPQSYGIFLDEEHCGNTAVSICAHERKPVSVHRYEKYRIVDQNVSTCSAPIFDIDENIIGFFSIVSSGGISIPLMENFSSVGAKSVGSIFNNKYRSSELIISALSEIIELGHKATLLIDSEGTIIAANRDCRRFLKVDVAGSPSKISDSLINAEDISCFILTEGQVQKKYCNIKTIYGKTLNCEILTKEPVSFPNGENYTAITFEVSLPGRQVSEKVEVPIKPSISIHSDTGYVGSSIAWAKVDNIVRRIAKFPSNVFIEGETGTGKEVVARAIHKLSGRKGNFVAINCGDIPDGLLQSELYGYEKGSFTGAKKEGSIGKLEYADHGTVFLDEIEDMPFQMQVSLLRFLQEKTIQRIGSNVNKTVDVRIIAATNKNIEKMLQEQTFRDDLYYRLNVINIKLPPLRERKDDIPALATYFLESICEMYRMPVPEIDEEVFRIFKRFDWKGNVRELRNAVEKLLIMSDGIRITSSTVYASLFSYDDFNNTTVIEPVKKINKESIEQALAENDGNITKAAASLNITRDTLYRRMTKYGISKER